MLLKRIPKPLAASIFRRRSAQTTGNRRNAYWCEDLLPGRKIFSSSAVMRLVGIKRTMKAPKAPLKFGTMVRLPLASATTAFRATSLAD